MDQSSEIIEEHRALHLRALRTVATLEFLKGLLVVCLGFGLITISRKDLSVSDIAESLLYFFHIDPGRHLCQVFLEAASRLDDANLVAAAMVAAIYSLARFIEAYGLWNARVWAEWFALLSGMIYLPLELYELHRKVTPIRLALLLVNIAVVAYMAYLRLPALRGLHRPLEERDP